MQQRYYESEVGRFLSVDPVTAFQGPIDQFNRYRYANNNPYSFTDPDGRCGTRIKGHSAPNCTAIEVNPSDGGDGRNGGSSARDQRSPRAPALQGSTGAPTSDGRIPVPGVVGWKTGEYEISMTPQQVDSAGGVITGAAVVGGGAIAVQAGAPYVAAASGGLIAGTKGAWRNLSFDGPSPGGLHANGRLLGVRWKGGQWGVRLDLHPINSGSTPILHINFGPPARGEAAHLILFDPRWIKKGGE
ncbi:uncharacterized protein RhaS with RHS repeats [Stenotrophomonas sp. 2619]|uniref:RHS repeat-associated core domain-containing protein n=1 Tax=Stenotrophomonas sp. 2619 TaxID=3156316 RepID=UPI0033940F7D